MFLNIGSGQRPFDHPFLNVDVNERWNPDIVSDGSSLPDVRDGSVECIVIHHMMEHVGCGEAEPLIKECYRMLCPGGSLLIFVPDMDALARRWIAGQLSTQVYMTNVYGAYMNHEADRHRWGYDRHSLFLFLRTAAFPHVWREVKPFNWRHIPGSDLARDWWVLAIEAVK